MSTTKKLFISLFLVVSFLSMIRTHLSQTNPLISTVYKPIDSYLSFFSIFQSWTMFSPDPARVSAYVTAEVEFADGSKDTYAFPRTTDLSFADRYIYGERMRVMAEAIRRDDGNYLWKDTAKYALRQLRDKNFQKIPLRVHLFRHWQTTPDIKKRFIPHLTSHNVFQSYKFYTHEVL